VGCLLAVILVVGAGCAVKPPLRYVAPDGTLHDVAVEPRRSRPAGGGVPAGPGAAAPPEEAPGGPAAPQERAADDEARSHYLTAVGLQGDCRFGEALSLYRGYLEAEPDGSLAGRAMVRMAEIYLDPGYVGQDEARARALLAEVAARFPGSAEATVACELLGSDCVP